MRRFEMTDGTSSKFWEVLADDKTLTVRFGKIGTNGQTQAKVLASPAAARAEHDKLVAEKTKKGYVEVGAAPAPAASAAAAPTAVAAEVSPLETDIVPNLLALGQAMLARPSQAAVWTGKITFPKGGVEKWRAAKVMYGEETVGSVLDRARAELDRGVSWLDVRTTGDVVEIASWDWRRDTSLQDDFERAIHAAAPFGAKGSVTSFEELHGGLASRAVYKLTGKTITVEEDEDDAPARHWAKDKGVKSALAAVAPRLGAWIDKHPDTRTRIEHCGLSGFIDRSGREVIEARFSSADDFSDGLAVVYDGWKAHFVDVDGRLSQTFYQAAYRYCRGLAPVAIGDSEHWGFVDRDGNVKVAPDFHNARPFGAALAMVQPERFGAARWVNLEGELVGDPFVWAAHDPKCNFADGRVWTGHEKLGGFGCFDEEARPAFPRRVAFAMPFSEGLGAVLEEATSKWSYIDRDGKTVIDAKFDEAHPFAEERAVVRIGETYRLIDKTGATVGAPFAQDARCARQLCGGMLSFVGEGGVGFLDRDGAAVVAPRFHEAYGFFEERAYVAVKATAKSGSTFTWGHIDRTGEYVVAPTLTWTNRYWDGLAPVKVGGLYGFLDLAGKIVIAPQYIQAQPRFVDGRAWVTLS